MIPRTFPSTRAANGEFQMVVFFLGSVVGLQKWVDYIPVRLATQAPGKENNYDQNGYINVTSIGQLSPNTTPFKDYVPVFIDNTATDAWTTNIAGYIPVGQSTFGGVSLGLDFTTTTTLDPRITFSRTSNATVTGPDGTLQWAPHNLLTFSEQFDNAAWTKNASATVTANAGVAPDGTTTADQLQGSLVNTGVWRVPTVTPNLPHVYSLHVKNVSNATALRIGCDANPVNAFVSFNAVTGTITSAAANVSASSVVDVGNGWYRVVIGFTPTTSAPSFIIYSTTGADATWLLWGAQLNVGSLQPYYPTTVKNLLGFTQEFDNAAWTKSNSFVQTNQIRNNTMQGAATPSTLPTNWGGSSIGLTRTVVGTGIENGINYIDVRFSGTTTGQFGNITFEPNNSVAASASQAWTGSLYVSLIAGSLTNVSQVGSALYYFNSSAVYVNATTTPLTISSSLTRYSGTGTTVATTAFVQPGFYFNMSAASGQAVDFTVRIGLPQLVQGTTAGDVVQTYGTARAVMYPAPDGSVTADKLVENTVNTSHRLEQIFTPPVGGVFTLSCYAKAAERSEVNLRFSANFPAGNTTFNLLTGTKTDNGTVSSSIVSVGNGWYRCSITQTATTSASTAAQMLLRDGKSVVYTGDGTSGILIWGAQLSDSASLDPYVYNPGAAPAAAAYYGPRFDYDPVTLAPRGLLIEEQRTNLLLQSEAIDNSSWTKTRVSISANAVVSPDGTQDADKIVEDTTASATHLAVSNSASLATATVYTYSVYAKAAERTWIRLQVGVGGGAYGALVPACYFNLANGTVGTASDSAVGSIQAVGNGWYRCVLVAPATTSASTADLRVKLAPDGTTDSYTGNGTSGAYIWGAQLEAGAFATSYIPTTTAAATRAADVAPMIGANFSNWYRQDEGTFFTEWNTGAAGTNRYLLDAQQTATSNNRIDININTSNVVNPRTVVGGSAVASLAGGTYATNTSAKLAFAYKVADYASSLNGASAVTASTAGVLPTPEVLYLGSLTGASQINGHLRRIGFFPRRLSNSELQAITA